MTELGNNYETEDLGGGRFRTTINLLPIAYPPNGSLKRITNILGNSGDPNMPVGVSELVQFRVRDKLAGQSPVIHFGRRQSGNFVKTTPLGTNNVDGIAMGKNGYKFVEAWDNADLELIIAGHRLQKNIYLKAGHPASFQFRIDDHSGLNPETLATSDFRILQPVLQNPATGESIGLTWGKEQSGGKTILTATLPGGNYAGWTLDPTVETIQPDGTAGKDTVISATAATINYGALTTIGIGEDIGFVGAIYRSLIQFDLSVIPTSAIISSTVLSLYATADLSNNARIFSVYKLKRSWVEGTKTGAGIADGATWNTYDGTNNWQTAGASGANDVEASAIGSRNFTASETLNQFKDFPLTGVTKTDLDLGYGWMIKAATELNDAYIFASSDNATAANRPKLVVTYTLPSTGRGYRGHLVTIVPSFNY